jgi:hypothetical protein
MPTFKRVALVGSEDLFRPTRPEVVSDTDDVIKDTVDRPGTKVKQPLDKFDSLDALRLKIQEAQEH